MALHTRQQLLQLYLLILVAAKASSQPYPGCPGACGNLSIHYPFGTRQGCYLDNSFFVSCDNTSNPPLLYLPQTNMTMTVRSISLGSGELRVSSHVVPGCSDGHTSVRFSSTHFSISPSKNRFVAVGCNMVGQFVGYDLRKKKFTAAVSCGSWCDDRDKPTNKSCTGNGCCEAAVPKGLAGFRSQTSILDDEVKESCAYAFVVEIGAYEFLTTDLKNSESKTVPVVLDWAVGDHTCQGACKAKHSECHNSTNGVGYICKCLTGFEGNPYLDGGCQDIRECSMQPNPCIGRCQELEGGYKCTCPEGEEGDGLRAGGKGCHPKARWNLTLVIALSLLALLAGSAYIYVLWKKKLIRIRGNYFRRNGGLFLQQQLALIWRGDKAQIFTIKELKKATNNFDEARLIGKGGHGTVYKGLLPDNRVIAIKQSKVSSDIEIGQFINEVVLLSQIHHRNVVQLLGCCLETKVPLLVYEFMTNGSLSDHIHAEESQPSPLSWPIRLRIATETAGALAYLHHAASTSIIHRDVKTANILLDGYFTAKLSDVGASKLVPLDQIELTTLVQGTLGYIDPEYFQTNQLTKKSDVYSFGIVLAELLTSKKAISFSRHEDDRYLSQYFVSSMIQGRLYEILDKNIVNDANLRQVIEVANVAKWCLMLKGEKRPTMDKVALELEGIMSEKKLSLGATNVYGEEPEYSPRTLEILREIARSEDGSDVSNITIGFDIWGNHNLKQQLRSVHLAGMFISKLLNRTRRNRNLKQRSER